MKTIILSLFTSIAVAFAVEARDFTVASFNAQQGGRFILTINGQRMNGQPASTLNLNHLRPGRNMVHVEYYRNGRMLRTRQAIFLSPGHETVFNIRGGRYGASISKIGEYPLRGRGRGNGNGNGYGHGHGHGHGDWDNYYHKQQFRDFMAVLRNARFEDRKFAMTKEFLRGRTINTNQLNRILNQFTFERDRIDITVFAYKYLRDPENLPNVFHQFHFRSSIREVNRRIDARYHGGPVCNPHG